ncbi:MAG: divergent polysaccharide deacetylase family protein [Firmicutes bacterium]|nr:divergent polysaccharide deacetylase family protein [Bacillota bacterium]
MFSRIKLIIFYAGVFAFSFAATVFTLNRRALTAMETVNQKCYLAIVIDDFGYGGEGTDEMLALDIPMTCALMPFSGKSDVDREKIINAGKEMIIHMPMESLTGKKEWVGDKGVFRTMTDEEVRACVNEAFEIADGAVGMNNHMGSAIMEDERCLSIVMEEAAKRGVVFLDSRTTPNSVAEELSVKFGTKLLCRDVFLDSTDDIGVVKERLMNSAEIALKNGSCVSIGHVGPEGGLITARAIAELAPEFEKKGIEFVTLSRLSDILAGK